MMDGVPGLAPDRMLTPVRRWALRELKVRPGHVVVVVGCRAPWMLPVLRDLVTDAGAVLVVEADLAMELPRSADRVLVDNGWSLGAVADVERLVSVLGPSGRLAAVCRRGSELCARLEDRLPYVRRESFYLGGAYALWGQIP